MRLHLVDGTYELFRSHYSKRPSRTAPDGSDIKATHGVLSSLLFLLSGEEDGEVTHLGVAFDNPIESFRNDAFPGYKTGEGIEPALRSQFDVVEEGVAALGLVVWSMQEFEADDALAAAAARFRDEVEQVRIMTPDKDLGQCVTTDDRVVQLDRRQRVLLDAAAIEAKHGVPPASIPDYLALVGDAADGIPGLPGFGKKGAAAVLQRFGHVDAIPDDPDEWDGVDVRGARGLAATLAEQRDAAVLYRMLATLVTDVPLAETIEDLCWEGAPPEFEDWCRAHGLDSLLERVPRWRS